MNCEHAGRLLPLLMYGELSFEEEAALEEHLNVCGFCRTERKRVEAMQEALDAAEEDLSPIMLSASRRELRLTIAVMRAANAAQRQDWRSWLMPLGAAALVAVGFFGARLAPPPEALPPVPPEVRLGAGPVASRVRYLEPNASGRVQIVVEETSQRTLSGDMDDEPIRRLLLTAARESADPGLRVDTMEILKSQVESSEVRRALIYALQHDTNAGVRLKALEGLRRSAGEPETRKALAQVLLTDANPGVRTQAIDLLIQKKEPEMVGVLQELMRKEENKYVRMRCQKALHDMNASVETF